MINSGFKPGFLEVYCGPMKSGKSKELLNRLDRIKYISGCKSLLVKPSLDTRDNGIKSRGGDYLFSQIINYDTPEEILNLVKEREQARLDKDWVKSDELRDKISSLGYQIKDSDSGPKISKI